MYFYCWVEICTNYVECAQRCTIISEYFTVCFTLINYTCCVYVMLNCPPTASKGERQKREAASESDQVQLISLGPLLLGQNNTEQEDNTCWKQNTSTSCSAQNCSSYIMEQQQHLNRMCSSVSPSVSGDCVYALWC